LAAAGGFGKHTCDACVQLSGISLAPPQAITALLKVGAARGEYVPAPHCAVGAVMVKR